MTTLASPAVHIVWTDTDNLIEVSGLLNVATGLYINNAEVTVTLKDYDSGSDVAGEAWPLTLNYVPASDGDYRATLPYDLILVEDQGLIADIIADGGVGLRRRWQLHGVATVGR
jgi:hypothetical protein